MTTFNYVKLGSGAIFLEDCIEKKYVQLGFELNQKEVFDFFCSDDWPALKHYYLRDGNARRAGNFIGQLKRARSAKGQCIWLTIEKGHLYWAQTAVDANWEMNAEGATLKVLGWNKADKKSFPITNDRIPGWLQATAQFKGTVCSAASNDMRSHAIQRLIDGIDSLARSNLRASEISMRESVEAAIQMLAPKDFELLIELIFSKSGWRRVGILGGTMKSIDLELELPTTDERAVAQFKSTAGPKVFQEFLKNVVDQWKCEKYFWVQHSGKMPPADAHPDVIIWDRRKIAQQVLDAGLVTWLGNKV